MSVTTTTRSTYKTPSGVEIAFESYPKRQYWVNDVPVPSATEVLDILSKPLVKWGQNIGVMGVLSLIEAGEIGKRRIDGKPIIWHPSESGRYHEPATVENVSALLKEKYLDHDAELTKAQQRGTDVHKALELFLVDGKPPIPEFYPEERQGYVTGLVKFLNDFRIDGRARVYSEVKVGSPTHGYAGTFDLLCKNLACELHTTPKRKREEFKPGWGIWDLKTSSSIFDTHHLQVGGAYRPALEECGYPVADVAGVIRVTEDGLYEVKRSERTQDDFLKILDAWKVVKGK